MPRVEVGLTLVDVESGTVQVPVAQMVVNGQVLIGHLTGSARDAEMATALAVATGRPLLEELPLALRNQAVQRLRRRAARSRIVLDPVVQP